MSTVREQVLAEMVAIGRQAAARGHDAYAAIEATFPGAPTQVVVEAWLKTEDEAVEAWWQGVEKTIDGEAIRNAVTTVSGGTA